MLLTTEALRRLCTARQLLREEADVPASIDAIAQTIGVSPFHFIRQFERVFGRTPHQFRIDERLWRARWLLAAGADSVTDICFDVGYESLGSFSHAFARRAGMPPSVYRARARAMIQVPGMPPPELFPGCLSLMGRLPASAFAIFEKHG